MNWGLVILVFSIVVLTLVLWLKHHGDVLYERVFDAVVERNKLVVNGAERAWCLGEIRSRWLLLTFLGFIAIGMKALFPGDEEADSTMIETAAIRCEDAVVHLLMHYRQDHSEQ